MSIRINCIGLAVAFIFIGAAMPAWGQVQPAYPETACKVTPDPALGWSAQEEWVWLQVCEGRSADLMEREGGMPMTSDDEWDLPADRVLSEAFLKTILLRAPYRDAIPEHGVWIIGALFSEELDFSGAGIDAQLMLGAVQFSKRVNFIHTAFNRAIGFSGSRFEQDLDLNGIHASRSVFLDNGALFTDVDLIGARIDGQAVLDDARFTGRVVMNGIRIGEHLLMSGSEFGPANSNHLNTLSVVDLGGAIVGGQVSMVETSFYGIVNMSDIQIGGTLIMRGSEFGPANREDRDVIPVVELTGANVDAQVTMLGAKFNGGLIMDDIHIGGPLLMSGAHFEQELNLFGAEISGSFQISEGFRDATWGHGASLDLRSARIQQIAVTENSLPTGTSENPHPLKLGGLQYQRIIKYLGGNIDNTLDSDWYKTHWLEKSKFSFQAYRELADALERDDRPGIADDILYASKEQHRRLAKGLSWVSLTLQKILIGYGYHTHRALFWFFGVVAIGAVVHRTSPAAKKSGPTESVFFSFDLLIPVMKLYEPHYDVVFERWHRYYFAAHIMMGFVLVSFILAGISGLTK